MRYSEEILEEVRSRNNIVDIISEYVPLKRKGAYYFGVCPFHQEKTGSFSVTPGNGIYYCFGCHESGNAITFLMKYNNMSFQEAVQQLAERAGVQLPEPSYSGEEMARQKRKKLLMDIQRQAAQFYYRKLRSPRGSHAMAYLQNRALSAETMRSFGLGYADSYSNELYRFLKSQNYTDEQLKDSGLFLTDPVRGMQDKFWNRVMFPIMNASGYVIAFGGRVMGDGKPKYLNSPETEIFDKSNTLYGLHLARRSRRQQMILCEGYMDVIALHQAGFDNAVASLGTSLTQGHISMLRRFTKELLLIYDSDEAGIRAALRALPMLQASGLNARVVSLAPHKDPDEFIKAEGKEAFEERLQKAENGFLFEIRMLQRRYDLSDPAARTAFFRQTAEELLRFEEKLERDSYLTAISRRYQVEPGQLQELLRKRAMSGGYERKVQQQPKPLPSAKKKEAPAESGERAGCLLLAWIAQHPDLLDQLSPYLKQEDFTGDFCSQAAAYLFLQIRNGSLDPSGLVSNFEDSDSQSKASAFFRTPLPDTDGDGLQRQLLELVCTVRMRSVEQRLRNSTADLQGLQKLMEEKKAVETLRRQGFRTGIHLS